jgi:ubiquinone/menaquinone biosynthesis C-methylase UbiE
LVRLQAILKEGIEMSVAHSTTETRRKPYGGIQMEGPIARWYARTTRERPDYPITARAIAAQLPDGGEVLEVAPGPGYMAIQLAQLGSSYHITGLDISRSFVHIATENAQRAGVEIDFQHGDVARMPFASNSFHFVVCQAAFKNFPDPVAALDEINRVLRPGGRASIYDLRKDAPADAIDAEIRSMQLSPLNALFMRWTFRFGLLREAYTRDRLDAVVAGSHFRTGEVRIDGIGFELRLVKSSS